MLNEAVGKETIFSNVETRNIYLYTGVLSRDEAQHLEKVKEKRGRKISVSRVRDSSWGIKNEIATKFSIGIANLNATQEICSNECRLLRLSSF